MKLQYFSCGLSKFLSRQSSVSVCRGPNSPWICLLTCSKDKPSGSHFTHHPVIGRRHFNASQLFTSVQGLSRQKEYQGRKLVGYTMEQMFEVVSDVDEYKNFVPFCMDSSVSKKTPTNLWGKLVIGFPPLLESYVSYVTLRRPHLVKAECSDGKVLNYLKTTWKFTPGLKSQPQSCVVHFYLSFEFKSLIHSQVANVFFSELVKKMEDAFVREAGRRYGRPSMTTIKLNIS